MIATRLLTGRGRLIAAGMAAATISAAPRLSAQPSGQGAGVTIGIPAPKVQMGDGSSGAELVEAIRQSLAKDLGGASVLVVPLQSGAASQVDAEAKQQHCDYVLYSSVEQKHAGSVSGLFHKLAPFTSALPMMGGLGHGAGGMTNALAAAGQGAASASAAASQQEMMEHMAGAQHSSVKAGDTVTFEYRLTAAGSADAIKTDKILVRAKSDGEDVLSPAIEQAATAVAAAVGQGSATGAAAPKAAAQTAPLPAGGHAPGGQQIDCDRLPASASAVISADACKKMMGAQQAYNQAAADPSAAHPGDEQMSCAQIAAELKTQSYTAPDKATTAQLQAAAAQEQSTLARQESELAKTVAAQTAAMNAAQASDTATAVATGGVVQTHKASALQQVFTAQNRATSERMAEERQPTETKMFGGTADIASSAGQQLAANPRLARLMQLAGAKHCKGG